MIIVDSTTNPAGSPGDLSGSTMKISGYCPTTGERILATEHKQCPINRDKVVWWRCPSCGGWHAMIIKRGDKPGHSGEA